MRNVYVVTMWTGDGPARKWKSHEMPTLLPQGTGVEFVNADTKLKVQVIGNISIEEYESGKEEIESMRSDWITVSPKGVGALDAFKEASAGKPAPDNQQDSNGESDHGDKGIHRLF